MIKQMLISYREEQISLPYFIRRWGCMENDISQAFASLIVFSCVAIERRLRTRFMH
jgi:hypothetical protein